MITLTYWVAYLALGSISSIPATAAPTRTNCRCVSIDESIPWTLSSALLDASKRNDRCSRLGPELERWRLVDPVGYVNYFADLVEKDALATSLYDELKPLPTGVLMELATRTIVDPHDPPRSATTGGPRDRIICREAKEKEAAEPASSRSSLFYMGLIIVAIVIACIAECINVFISWINLVYERRKPVRLPGGEKDLRAWSVPDGSFTEDLDASNIEDEKRALS